MCFKRLFKTYIYRIRYKFLNLKKCLKFSNKKPTNISICSCTLNGILTIDMILLIILPFPLKIQFKQVLFLSYRMFLLSNHPMESFFTEHLPFLVLLRKTTQSTH